MEEQMSVIHVQSVEVAKSFCQLRFDLCLSVRRSEYDAGIFPAKGLKGKEMTWRVREGDGWIDMEGSVNALSVVWCQQQHTYMYIMQQNTHGCHFILTQWAAPDLLKGIICRD